MEDFVARAEAALIAGRRDEAIELLAAAAANEPAQPVEHYVLLLRQLSFAGRAGEGETWAVKALEHHGEAPDLWNMRGVHLRALGRLEEALTSFGRAGQLDPGHLPARLNAASVLLQRRDFAGAASAYEALLATAPDNAAALLGLGQAQARLGRRQAAVAAVSQATTADPTLVAAWLELIENLHELHRDGEAVAAAEAALRCNPDRPRLVEAKAVALRRAGQTRAAIDFLAGFETRFESEAWFQFLLGDTIRVFDRPRASAHLRRAIELNPAGLDPKLALLQNLVATLGGDEGPRLDEAYELARGILGAASLRPAQTAFLANVFAAVCAFDSIAELGSFEEVGRAWAAAGLPLLLRFPLARTLELKRELLEQHRIWGRRVEARAALAPIRRSPPRAAGRKVRLGFMSSDLRRHAVGYFARPLFDHIDHERFEVFAYSYFRGREDQSQREIAQLVDSFRWWPDISPRDAAQRIADDDLDMLIEVGGPTPMNKLDVMAYRPAPRQASWLAYPHSAGLSVIDDFICDAHAAPADPSLLIERPLLMPHTWVVLGPPAFSTAQPLSDGLPEERRGFLTFGTMNNPYKYSREALRAWARIVGAVPGSRFAFVRPEAGSAVFRRNVEAEFAAEGIGADRLIWRAVRGQHLPIYGEIDITLDTFPLTGGTTTAEALWMGAPVVSLVGEAFFERLSYSLLSNAGLGELCTADLDSYHRTAVELAGDRARRARLRRSLRETIRQGPLGQPDVFARDFYDMIWRAVRGAAPSP